MPVGPVEVRRDVDRAGVTAALAGRPPLVGGGRRGTPWLELRLRFANGAGQKEIDLGKRSLNGSDEAVRPGGHAGAPTLLAADSSSNTATVLARRRRLAQEAGELGP